MCRNFCHNRLACGCRKNLFGIFIPEPEVIALGASYLKIIGISQLPQAVEILTAGAFIGLGKTAPPSIVGISLNLLRIPVALLLSATALGLDGVWWAISLSSILKGIVLEHMVLAFYAHKRRDASGSLQRQFRGGITVDLNLHGLRELATFPNVFPPTVGAAWWPHPNRPSGPGRFGDVKKRGKCG